MMGSMATVLAIELFRPPISGLIALCVLQITVSAAALNSSKDDWTFKGKHVFSDPTPRG